MLVVGFWFLVFGCWLLVVGFWFLVFWLLVVDEIYFGMVVRESPWGDGRTVPWGEIGGASIK